MKYVKLIAVSLSFMILLSACSPSSTGNEQTLESTVGEEHTIIRSASKVTNDAQTKTIITSQESFQIGTHITIKVYDDKEVPKDAFDQIFSLIDTYEYMVSKTINTSEVTEVNNNAGLSPVNVSDSVVELVEIGQKYAALSDGLFDVTIGPLVDLWGIGTEHAAVPSDEARIESMGKIDYRKIDIDKTDKTIFLQEAGMEIDLGAIAKGFIADRVKDLILELGYEHAIINLGGNVLTVGTKPNSDAWQVGVRDPQSSSGSTMGILKLEDNSIVSSGIYERFFNAGEIRYHHIINPKTGAPEFNGMYSVSIVSDTSVDGDALSTTVFLLGLEKGLALIESLPNIEAVFVMEDQSVYVSSGLGDRFILTEKSYTIKSISDQ